jgi:hypothetical protein
MKKTLFKSLLLLLLMCFLTTPAFASGSVDVDISVQIEGGGTAIIIPQVNCPIPQHSDVTVKDGETGHFNIQFTEPGNYAYTIQATENGCTPDYYAVNVSVNTKEDGTLYSVTVLKRSYTATKCGTAAFTKEGELPPEETTKPIPPNEDEGSTPYTGDDSRLEMYLLLAIAASAGLFGLSLIYANSVKKQLKK